jgi:hypothetical protein
VDYSGNVLTYNGSSWSSPKSIDTKGPRSISCPTRSFCAAVDASGNVLTYNGSSWSSPKSIDAGRGLYSVSCPTSSFCVAVDGRGNVLTYGGSSWSSPESIDRNEGGLQSVSCPTASFCAAVDFQGYAFTYPLPATSKTALNPSATKVTYGHEQVLHLSVTVSSAYSGSPPTGTVTVKQSTTTLCVITLSSAKGSCTLSAEKLPAGTYGLVATYGGSADFKGSTSAKKTLTVAKATSKTALKLSATKVTYGHEQVLILSVTVSPEFAGSTPTGTVTIKESTTTLCAISLSGAKGSCTLSAKKLPVGAYSLVATYGGSANFKGSTSAKETLTVAK